VYSDAKDTFFSDAKDTLTAGVILPLAEHDWLK